MPLAKDGADLPQSQRRSREARQLVTVGETYDFEIQPTLGKPLWLELRRGNGEFDNAAVLMTHRSGLARRVQLKAAWELCVAGRQRFEPRSWCRAVGSLVES